MRKMIMATLTLMLIFGALFAPAALQASEISVTIDGVAVDFEGQPPTIVGGRTLVPVRGVFEALGFDVRWEQAILTAAITNENHEIFISIGLDFFSTNGEEFPLDVPAQIIEGRTLLPIRAVLESVGYEVDWDGSTQTVVVTSPPAEEVAEANEPDEPTVQYVYIRGTRHNTSSTTLVLQVAGLTTGDLYYPMRYFTNLELLVLSNNQITSLTPFASLTSLESLWLSNNQIIDLTPLAGLTNLTTLQLGNNQITDLTPLAGLTNLENLGLFGNQISNLRPLSRLTSLHTLDLHINQISDLSGLENLTNLENLGLYTNQISNLAPLARLTNLTDLSLFGNRITDWSPVQHVPDVMGRPQSLSQQ